ncbi:hypothetical protein A9P82_10625 [Arachidicoccus ginsenosidimutans]|uniref:hypothetical protein n=1 Tax=Arachidicoccus sp. BS20 TaxID=1850526 RepID=UPI0007F04E8A|nr:hypothetical protein [Arachidicoccus sp. BS20]ANI89703.1 hypothetical protein A9P82_10625 [Arachidicoccus sp. BS20]
MKTKTQFRNISDKSALPKLLHVKIYFIQKDMREEDAENFFLFHKKANWKTKRGRPIANWRTVANE